MRLFRRCRLYAIILAAVAVADGFAWSQSAWYEGFEGGTATWREAGANVPYRLLKHQRLQGREAHTGQGCEWLQVAAEGGTYVYFSHDIGRPRVITELMPSVWIKSDRPGITLLIRVVLPRTLDRRTNRPIATLLMGSKYNDVGRWQQLRIADVPLLLTRQIQMLHAQLGPNIDGREAYVDAVFLNVYSGPGVTNVWIDDLDVAGYVGPNPAAGTTTEPGRGTAADGVAPDGTEPGLAANSVSLTRDSRPPTAEVPGLPGRPDEPGMPDKNVWPPAPSPALSPSPAPHEIKLSGSTLTINGHAIFPRAIEYQGEPLGYLKQLGFNTLWLKRPPAPEILVEAAHWGLWIVCPPPRPVEDHPQAPGRLSAELGPAYNVVLLWNLGEQLSAEHLEYTRQWERQIRAADNRVSRPLICSPRAELKGYSRLTDLLLLDCRPLGTSLELKDYGTWVRRQPLLARLGTPVWTTVQTQLQESWRQQIAGLAALQNLPLPPGEGGAVMDSASYEQMELMAYMAVASGARGLLFLSSRPLDAPDRATRQRAAALELLNLKLALVDPWGAAGEFLATAESSSRAVAGTLLRTEHARLLMPLTFAPGAQYAVGASAVSPLSLVAPGVPEACNAYEMTPAGLLPLKHQRVAGGTRIDLEKFALAAQVLLANDPLILAGVMRRSVELGRRAGQLQRELAAHRLERLQAISSALGSRSTAGPKSNEWLAAASKDLQACDRQLAAGDLNGATLSSGRALMFLRQIERSYWDFAAQGLDSPVTSPPAVCFATLPLHWRLIERIRTAQFGPNLLSGGDFEDFPPTENLGWRHGKYPGSGWQTDASLVPRCAHTGKLGLRLSVTPTRSEDAPAIIECPPQWFTSPPVRVTTGQLLCIHGWVNVPRAITGSVNGLMIYDSLGGEALAQRIGQTRGWREFALYRAALQDGTLTVVFAMTGLGEAWIDDVQVQVLEGENSGQGVVGSRR